MRKLIVSEFMTLDGVIQGPGGPDEDRSGGFEHGGWQMQFPDDAVGQFVDDAVTGSSAFLVGRRTYDIFAGYWPNQSADDAFVRQMNETPKYVVSTTLPEEQAWQPTTVLRDTDGVRRVKAEDGGGILLFGSAELVQGLIRDGLVDEFRLMVYPLVLGTGKRLFRDGTALSNFELIGSNTTTNGVLLLRYRPK